MIFFFLYYELDGHMYKYIYIYTYNKKLRHLISKGFVDLFCSMLTNTTLRARDKLVVVYTIT